MFEYDFLSRKKGTERQNERKKRQNSRQKKKIKKERKVGENK